MRYEIDTPFGKRSIEVRYVIKNASGSFFTEMKQDGVPHPVMANGQVVAHEQRYLPQFEAAHARWASQFDTQQDGEAVMRNPLFGGPDSFAGCVVVPSE